MYTYIYCYLIRRRQNQSQVIQLSGTLPLRPPSSPHLPSLPNIIIRSPSCYAVNTVKHLEGNAQYVHVTQLLSRCVLFQDFNLKGQCHILSHLVPVVFTFPFLITCPCPNGFSSLHLFKYMSLTLSLSGCLVIFQAVDVSWCFRSLLLSCPVDVFWCF